MSDQDRLNVVVFAGGRGATTLLDVLKVHSDVNLTVIVNAYDDGLSTGTIRRFIPGMLGPSDIRKNIANLMPDKDADSSFLKRILESRLPLDMEYGLSIQRLRQVANTFESTGLGCLDSLFSHISVKHAKGFCALLTRFLDYCSEQESNGIRFDFSDCSIGNLLLAGAFLLQERNFNRSISFFQDFCGISSKVLNVTDGQNLVLVGIKEDGQFLRNEAAIVGRQNEAKIRDIFLLPDYVDLATPNGLSDLSCEDLAALLRDRSVFPTMNPEIVEVISSADLIIYGPGTQHSSLFPSYMTLGLGRLIQQNKNAEKIFISNILKDYEIQGETPDSLAQKLLYYMSCKGQWNPCWQDFVSTFFIQVTDHSSAVNYIKFEQSGFTFPLENVVLGNWEDLPGKHSGGRVFDEIISIVNSRLQKKLKPYRHQISILVPALNEERTVAKVLYELTLLDFQSLGISKEIIFIDGGSTDRTWERASSIRDVRILRLQEQEGRGAALRAGLQKASGNIIAFFPCDDEYAVTDLKAVVETYLKSDFRAVFGSRAIKCADLSQQVRQIYPHNYLGYLVSKYGGIVLSILCLLLYNRYLSDVLTGIKVFDARLLKQLRLSCRGVDLDLEIIAKLITGKTFILEIPVEYKARRKNEGKKTTILDGLKAIWVLLRTKWQG